MKIINFMICDDIRMEMGNKHSIIGLYDDSINFSVPIIEKGKWPKTIKLGIFIKAIFDNDLEKKQIEKFRLEVSLNDKAKTIAEGNFDAQKQLEATGINLVFVFNQFVFESSGLMSLKIVFIDHHNNEIDSEEYPYKVKITEVILQ